MFIVEIGDGEEVFGEPLRGFARFGLPILLICVGLYILLDSPTDAIVTP